jgi:hypothetical protein
MRKMRAERPSKLQQNHLGMESNVSRLLDVAAMIGAEGASAAADGPGRRAVSFLGSSPSAKSSDTAAASRLAVGSDKFSGGPVGWGRGRRIGEAPAGSGDAGGRREGIMGDSPLGPVPAGDGGGDRRGGMTGFVSGFWGSALRTLSFGGSAISNQGAPRKIAENSFVVTR